MSLPIHQAVTDAFGKVHPIKLMSIYIDRHASCVSDYLRVPVPVEVYEHTVPEIAIYSDDRPLEFWRTIPGFVEAPTED